jgi:hypothetical protein
MLGARRYAANALGLRTGSRADRPQFGAPCRFMAPGLILAQGAARGSASWR